MADIAWKTVRGIAFKPVRPSPADQLAQTGAVSALVSGAPACCGGLQAADPCPDADVVDVVAPACGVKTVRRDLIVQHHHGVRTRDTTMESVVVVDDYITVLPRVRVLDELGQR